MDKEKRRQERSKWFNESLDRNTLILDNKLLIFLLSFLVASLLLVTNPSLEWWVALISLITFVFLLVVLLLLIRQQTGERWRFRERGVFESRWGLLGIATLGFGLGVLIYHNRAWFIWLWQEFRKIDKLDEWTLVSLFLLGVILGVFVVRNWSKEQKDFITSLTAVFGAAFISTILGTLGNQSGSVLTQQNSFALYALGFTLSAALNLLAFSMLIARYTRTRSLTSRSLIDFLYGSDKAQAIDLYFVRNFEADPDYAKEKLVAALSAYREIISEALARTMNERMRKTTRDDAPLPFDYYELISVKSVRQNNDPPTAPPEGSVPVPLPNDSYEIVFRKIEKTREEHEPITPKMFRVAISMRWLDNLEYVVTAGEYKQSFPYYGSVAGMSLLARKTIVMDRDKDKKFRTTTYLNGKTPSQADQPRGLYEIDYLSYICAPMASSFGKPEEQPLGVLHVDTKLFVYPKDKNPLEASVQPDGDGKHFYRKIIRVDPSRPEERLDERLQESLKKLVGYAGNLYVQNDQVVTDLEKMRDVIIPLLELYKKCRTGAINETKPAA